MLILTTSFYNQGGNCFGGKVAILTDTSAPHFPHSFALQLLCQNFACANNRSSSDKLCCADIPASYAGYGLIDW